MPSIDENYAPSESEPYMNDRQLAYFKGQLLAWRDDILRVSGQTLAHLQQEENRMPDSSDWASAEMSRGYELRSRDRERKLLGKIGEALERIEDGTYGYCEDTGEPIGIKRLQARPIATLSIEAQEQHEKRERVYRDR